MGDKDTTYLKGISEGAEDEEEEKGTIEKEERRHQTENQETKHSLGLLSETHSPSASRVYYSISSACPLFSLKTSARKLCTEAFAPFVQAFISPSCLRPSFYISLTILPFTGSFRNSSGSSSLGYRRN